MTEVIYTCNCGDTDKFAKTAYHIVFPDKEAPNVVHAIEYTNNAELNRVIKAIKISEEKFAYYIGYDKNNFELWDLLKGVRVQ